MLTEINFNRGQSKWLRTNELNDLKQLKVPAEFITYALDKSEQAHIDYDPNTEMTIIIFNSPNQSKIDNHHETVPITFLIKAQQIIVVDNSDGQNAAIVQLETHLKTHDTLTVKQLLFTCLFSITDAFIPYVDEMNHDRQRINLKLKEKVTKQNLFELSDLDTGNVFFISAAKQNLILLQQIKAHLLYQGLNTAEKEQYEDAIIEAEQLVEMTQLSAQILQQLAGTYNNVLNNNINDTMKVLTILSILLTVPTIITGFFGMNMRLPLIDSPFSWVLTILLSIIIWLILARILKRYLR